MVKTPQYVRWMNIINNCGRVIELAVNFKSQSTEVYSVPVSQQTYHIQRQIQHDTYTSVDPIQNVTFKLQGENKSLIFDDAQCIEGRVYVISPQFSITRNDNN